MENKNKRSFSGSLIKIEQTVQLPIWLRDFLYSIEKLTTEELSFAVSSLQKYNQDYIRSKNDNDSNIYAGLLDLLDIAAKEKSRKAGMVSKRSIGIKAAVTNIKKDYPNISANKCWDLLLSQAEKSKTISVDNITYMLSTEEEDVTDQDKVRVISINDKTGQIDRKGIVKRTLINSFKQY